MVVAAQLVPLFLDNRNQAFEPYHRHFIFGTTMNVPPLSLGAKLAMAIFVWLVVTFFTVPLWELASVLFEAYRAGSLLRAAAGIFLHPAGTVFALVILLGIQIESGIKTIVSHNWPAFLISSAFTALFLRWWWRRS